MVGSCPPRHSFTLPTSCQCLNHGKNTLPKPLISSMKHQHQLVGAFHFFLQASNWLLNITVTLVIQPSTHTTESHRAHAHSVNTLSSVDRNQSSVDSNQFSVPLESNGEGLRTWVELGTDAGEGGCFMQKARKDLFGQLIIHPIFFCCIHN